MMDIIYRISPGLSAGAVRWVKDKEKLTRACFNSFYCHVTDQNLHLQFDSMDDFIKTTRSTSHRINEGTSWGSFAQMIKLGAELTGDTILFLEDDYLWKPDADLKVLERAINALKVVTPYDHPDHYHHPTRRFHQIEVFENRLYRNCITTTHTFGMTRSTFEQSLPTLLTKQFDWQMWQKLDMEGATPWAMVDSMSSHLAHGHLAIGFDWEKYYSGIPLW